MGRAFCMFQARQYRAHDHKALCQSASEKASRILGSWAESRAGKDRTSRRTPVLCFEGTARVCLSLGMFVRALCDRNRAGIAGRRDRKSFSLDFFCSLMLF